MITIGSKKRLGIGSWILAALLLIGYNGFTLISLFNPSLVGRSHGVKLASEKWRQLKERTSSAIKNTMNFDPDSILSRMIPGFQTGGEKPRTSRTTAAVGKAKAVRVDLPILAGIMRISDIQGDKHLLAVIEGRTYKEKDRVRGYTIQRITEKGIDLTRAGAKWFVPTPEVYFSLDRNGSAD